VNGRKIVIYDALSCLIAPSFSLAPEGTTLSFLITAMKGGKCDCLGWRRRWASREWRGSYFQ
jgi:hypothetical protein